MKMESKQYNRIKLSTTVEVLEELRNKGIEKMQRKQVSYVRSKYFIISNLNVNGLNLPVKDRLAEGMKK